MKNKISILLLLITILLPLATFPQSLPGTISGVVRDKATGETMPGVNVVIEGTLRGASTDAEGRFNISAVSPGTCNLVFTFISYKPLRIEEVIVRSGSVTSVDAVMEDESVELDDIVVVATKRTDSEVSVMNSIKNSPVVVSGVSAQLISRTQDKDASEVVRRLPGVSIVDDRFIVVRGLSSRYNNVWLNNSTAPSLEADVRSFSFDLIPTSMIENIFILKSPTAELPSDYSGGFIKISTTGIPSGNGFSVSYGTSLRQYATFENFMKDKGGNTDWLTAGVKHRELPDAMPAHLDTYESATNPAIRERVTELGRSLNNSWDAISSTALPDQKFSLGMTRRYEKGKFIAGNVTSFTYSYSNTFRKAMNNSYSIYNYAYDTPGILDEFTDLQYKASARIGLMHNWTVYPLQGMKAEFRNFFTSTSGSGVTMREGRDWYNNGRSVRSGENKYTNRLIYSGQLGMEQMFSEGKTVIDFTAGYSISSRSEPDIRRYRYISNDGETSPYILLFGNNPDLSSVSRMWLGLDETNLSGMMNFFHKFALGTSVGAEIKTGIFAETRDRSFNARNFGYAISDDTSPFSATSLPVQEIFAPENINLTDGLRLKEITSLSDSYSASAGILAAYASLRLRFSHRADLSVGLRVEKDRQELDSYRQGTTIPVNVVRDTVNLFPSANLAWNLSSSSLVRLTYGMSVNRPEFREMAPFYFVDFDQNAGIYGNEDIKQAYIHNFDLRYELYPGNNETFNAGIFFKHFTNPIEVAIRGNNPTQFSFDNISSAYSFGLETEARKNLGFITDRLEKLTAVVNLSLIKSSVAFDRPLQGQSPYIVNFGLFWQDIDRGFMASLVYNRIGKRIIAVGRPSPNEWESIPDIYEMPRNEADLSVSKKVGERFEIKAGIKDLFGEKVVFQQRVNALVDMAYYGGDGSRLFDRTQNTRSYYPGRQFSIGISMKI
ncbi:MAG: TonB-dependent receptor [Bacteroidales bacterium]|jgi:outer membrane receptor for ferrienterochelin and colicin|nr:TonB-dependent receptor [Bacteroidales bacterium]